MMAIWARSQVLDSLLRPACHSSEPQYGNDQSDQHGQCPTQSGMASVKSGHRLFRSQESRFRPPRQPSIRRQRSSSQQQCKDSTGLSARRSPGRWTAGLAATSPSAQFRLQVSTAHRRLVPGLGNVTVTATSAVDTTLSATAQVTVTQKGPPTITQLSASTANAADSMQVNGTGFAGTFAGASGTVTVVFPGPEGIPLAVLP